MIARPQPAYQGQMTVEEFLAFTDTRPDEERWELIEGVPVLSPAPVQLHQLIAANIVSFLGEQKATIEASWLPLLGVGTRVPASPRSLPQPDVYVQAGAAADSPVTDDALVIFEVLSRSNTAADQAWRKRVYSSVPNCAHYVTVSQKAASVSAFDRATDWRERKIHGLDASLDLPALDLSLPLSRLYRWTSIAS